MNNSKKEKQKNTCSEAVSTYKVKPKLIIQVKSVFRNIGNSKGLIISKKIMNAAGLHSDTIMIEASQGEIKIIPISEHQVNTDLSTWGKQFKDALKKGQSPEEDLFNGMKNKFDEYWSLDLEDERAID